MAGDNGILFPALIPAPPFGWHVQSFQPPFRLNRLPAMLRGDDGTYAEFVNWLNAGWEVQHFQPPYRRQFLVIDYWSGRAIEATHGLIPGCIFYGRADAALVYGRADYAIVYGNPCAC
jgi:hypothetical protein